MKYSGKVLKLNKSIKYDNVLKVEMEHGGELTFKCEFGAIHAAFQSALENGTPIEFDLMSFDLGLWFKRCLFAYFLAIPAMIWVYFAVTKSVGDTLIPVIAWYVVGWLPLFILLVKLPPFFPIDHMRNIVINGKPFDLF